MCWSAPIVVQREARSLATALIVPKPEGS